MKRTNTCRGFDLVTHPTYTSGEELRVIQQSSAVGDYEDALDRPGSSYLWVGRDHHLNREEVDQLVTYLKRWLEDGTFGEPARSPQ